VGVNFLDLHTGLAVFPRKNAQRRTINHPQAITQPFGEPTDKAWLAACLKYCLNQLRQGKHAIFYQLMDREITDLSERGEFRVVNDE
jgi:hypothetical protein